MHTTPANNAPPSLWRRLRHAWAAFMGRKPRMPRNGLNAYAELVDTAPSPLEPQAQGSRPQGQRGMVPYNTQALPAAREQWQRGDWASLASLTLDELQDHPDRAKLALLAAAAHLHQVNKNNFQIFIKQAKNWGADESMIRRITIATTLKTISNAQMYAGHKSNSIITNTKAIAISNIKTSRES